MLLGTGTKSGLPVSPSCSGTPCLSDGEHSFPVCLQAPAQYQRKPSCRAAEQPSAALPPQQPPQQHTAERTTPPQQHTAERTILSLPTALALYGLTHSELLWELQLDTRCLMGWSDSKIVLAFRGTASITNAWSDLQVMMVSARLHVHG